MQLPKLAQNIFLFAVIMQPLAVTARPVLATVYHPWYNNRMAYCGSIYRHDAISAAHPWLPCGTVVRVSHKGRQLNVPITDRCECNSIDLSGGAARRLGVPLDGTAKVQISY